MERSTDVQELLVQFCESLSRGDASSFEQATSHQEGVLYIGSDPAEWLVGYDRIVAVFKAQLDELGGAMPITLHDAAAFREGSVGWAYAQPALNLPDGNEVRFRVSLVLHQEGGGWRIVHGHASIGVPNEQAVGRQLTV
jgi:ketosteroid isomerase-like protein